MLEVRKLDVGYGKLQVLFGVDVQVENGAITGILGPNGSGKSTLLKSIFGIITPWKGEVNFDGRLVTGLPPNKIGRLGVSFVVQGRSIFPAMTVKENLEVACYALGKDLTNEHYQLIRNLFPNLMEKLGDAAGSLSGGEQRMLEIARGVLFAPKLLLIDEPSAGLAPNLMDIIYKKLISLNKEYGMTILLVEQNVHKAIDACETIYVLELGRNKYQGPADDEKTRRTVLEAYLA